MDISLLIRKEKKADIPSAEILRHAFTDEHIRTVLKGSGQRHRIYDPVTTFCIWLGQTLSADHACRDALAEARSAGLVSAKASINTGGYCQARDRLDETALHTIAADLGLALSDAEQSENRWHGRRVVIPDGSSVTLPDTPANQAAFPQSSQQKPGCGFPIMYLCVLMSLASGGLLACASGTGNGNELKLWRSMWPALKPDDIVLGDGRYSSYGDMASLQARGVDSVARLGKRKTDFKKGTVIALDDHIVHWNRPVQLPAWLKDRDVPETLAVRELRFRVEVPGFRPDLVILATTLLDALVYTHAEIAELFFCRWQVELRLRDMKTSLGMEALRTKTPVRARKELWIFLVAYNLLRSLMNAAACQAQMPVARISFQGCRQRLRAALGHCTEAIFPLAYTRLIGDIAKDLVPYRPFRIEPRAIKRRKKQYNLLSQPRAVLQQKLIDKAS